MRVRSGHNRRFCPSASTPWPTIRQLQWGKRAQARELRTRSYRKCDVPTHDHFKGLVIIVLANFACRHTKFVRARRYRRRCLISPTRKFSGMYRKIAPVTDNVVRRSTASRCLGLFIVRTRGLFWKPPYPSSRHGYCYVRHWIVYPDDFGSN